jgi:regulator of cell morphogenesis and NO signaling
MTLQVNLNPDPAAIGPELSVLEPGVAPGHPDDSAELTRYIVARFHDAHRAQLPELIRLARNVERVHAYRVGVPAGLAKLLEQLQQDLLDHMAIEETVLFPMMAREPDARIAHPIAMMRADHDVQARAVERMFALTRELELPEGACNTWRALYLGLRQFADDLIEHVHIENDGLFKRYEAAASAGAIPPGAAGHSDTARA